MSNQSIEVLNSYNFPGNVRELKAIVELACVLCDDVILPEHFKINPTGSITNLLNQPKTLKEYNALIVEHFLEKHNNNVVKVAKLLDVGKSTLYRMINSGTIQNK
jgi:DNA-binding NtrC family response regulator